MGNHIPLACHPDGKWPFKPSGFCAIARVVWLAKPASSKIFNRILRLSSGKKFPQASGPKASWILASTTNKYAGLMVRFKTMSEERWVRNFFKMPKSLGSANNGICTAELSAIFAGMARIALNARLLIPGRLEGIGWFTDACYRRIIADHPEHEFLLLFDRTPAAAFEYGPNATSMRLLPPARRP